jgi:hypothetical protein
MSRHQLGNWRHSLAWVGALAVLAACGSRIDPHGTDSSSHWLSSCDEDTECPSEQSCLCGVCTRKCDDARDCRSLDQDAVCIAVDDCNERSICTREDTENPQQSTPDAGPGSASESPSDAALNGTCDTQACQAQCALVLEAASADAPCLGNDAQCAQFQSEDVQRRVTLVLAETDADDAAYTEAELQARRDCVANWLTEHGLRPSAGVDVRHVDVPSEWSFIAPLIASAGLVGYDVACADCSYCSDLREDGCNADAFCAPYIGRPFNDQYGCWYRSQMRECLPAGVSCDEGITLQGDGGNCWVFSRGCSTTGLSEGIENCGFWSGGIPDAFGDEHDSCEDPPFCVGPEDPELAFEIGRLACDCEQEGAMVCNSDTSFTCNKGKWEAGYDGMCENPQGRCDRTFESLEACLSGGHDCVIAPEDGDPICGLERSTLEVSARPRFDADQCAAIGGTVSEYDNDVWVNMPAEDQYCLVADWLTGEQCASVGGNVRCIAGTTNSFCRNDETPIVQLSNCQAGAGYCCVPDNLAE